jgi:purine-nucleoside phosphorylase
MANAQRFTCAALATLDRRLAEAAEQAAAREKRILRHLRDLVLALSASTLSTPSRGIFREINFAPTADFGLLHAAWQAAQARGISTHAGGIYSSDAFYDERPDLNDQLQRHGVLCVEMEAAELYTVAARHGARCNSHQV